MKQLNLLLLLIFCAFSAFSQKTCDYELSKEEITKALDGYQYLKTFRVDGKDGRLNYIEYTIVMKKGDSYKFHIETPDGVGADGIVMKVYDRRTKTRVLTNFTSSGLNTDFTYTSTKTGIYDVRFSFRGSKKYCGVCICGQKSGGA